MAAKIWANPWLIVSGDGAVEGGLGGAGGKAGRLGESKAFFAISAMWPKAGSPLQLRQRYSPPTTSANKVPPTNKPSGRFHREDNQIKK